MPTKKDFQMVASIIRDTPLVNITPEQAADYRQVIKLMQQSTAQRFADEFARQNPRFDRARFLTACGL